MKTIWDDLSNPRIVGDERLNAIETAIARGRALEAVAEAAKDVDLACYDTNFTRWMHLREKLAALDALEGK